MGPAAAYRYTGDEKSQKKNPVSKKPAFPTLEEKAACKQYEEGKDYDVNCCDIGPIDRFFINRITSFIVFVK